MKVLFVDDNEDIREQAKIFLSRKKAEIDVDIASSAEEGLKKVFKNDYDIIISDYKMPGRDGISFLRELRDDGDDTPFIILTGYGGYDVRDEAEDLGASHFLAKGTDPKEMYDILTDYIEEIHQEKLRENYEKGIEDVEIKTLFVDDNPDIVEQAKIFLERADDRIKVEGTTSVDKALQKIEKENYNIIVSDYKMPKTDGIEFLKILREEKRMDIPFIVFTGKGGKETARRALQEGSDHIVLKGKNPKNVYTALAQKIIENAEFRKF